LRDMIEFAIPNIEHQKSVAMLGIGVLPCGEPRPDAG